MCAIAGLFDLYHPSDIDAGLLQRMTDIQAHRGPDGVGMHREPGVGLGHRRLAIIDIGGGRQPLFNEDHSVAVVYNGEIYNFPALMRELQQFGHSFRTHCDTEVIVHAWEQWGERCVEHFRGMFAFALWDRRQHSLFLARDRLGIKPLHYAVLENGQLIFASEIKALLAHDGLRRDLDPLAVEEYFAYGYIPEPRTVFRQIRKLEPGHTLLTRRGAAPGQPRRYWDVPFKPATLISPAHAADELIARLREAVRIRLVAEVPLGAFLSGGDENLAGYRRYRWHLHEERLRAMLPLLVRRSVFGALGRLYPKADWAPRPLRAKTTFEALARDSVAAYFHGVSIMSDQMRERLFSPKQRHDLGGYHAVEVQRRHAAACPAGDALSLVQYLDLKTYLPGDILTKVDRASMAHGLEVRVPLLDHQLVEWMSGLPPSLKLRGGVGKYLFKKGLEPYLPTELLYRDKMGFSVPLADWFRGPLRSRLQRSLTSPALADCGMFDLDYVQELLRQHQSGRRDHSAPLWSLLMFESFLRRLQRTTAQEPAEQVA
ncbi:asparagine synthase (glutamine-hydrolyzing) [Duganella aceris]|uniref:asparagine synthase (glutamine-hydrolyzing) n=1 Tax=Duganella aceris TaxID=2703883 RepID=A0ABX0FR22_9BURK|nr:asparagine synthase (glutamine-hydrolyzing) [Duganella aceris]NGZ87099.1 asparagine synthase (glutamine-hydrolyzing) [Duganella aceris]